MYKYIKTTFKKNEHFFNDYLQTLSARYDDFLEDHILNSEFYSLFIDEVHCGYFAIFEKTLMTQFFITRSYFKHAQIIFKKVLDELEIKEAFVPTCDELFLSLSLDQHKKINLQAYFFEESQVEVAPANYSRELLSLARLDDLEEIKLKTGDFVDNHEERIKDKQLYILRENQEFLGLGIIIDNKIMHNCQGTGMFTHEKHRGKGVGRSIILHLKDICHEHGKIPLPGCWYYNHNSKKTLESAGYISKTRLLRIEF